MASLETFGHLALALAIGLLIGLERGWQKRGAPQGHRVAGFRTFALMGLIGGIAGLMAQIFGGLVLAGTLLAVSISLAVYFWRAIDPIDNADTQKNLSATTAIAALLTVMLGALVMQGYPRLAVSAAVIATLLLSLREPMHGLLRHIDETELAAALRFLLISVVVLPLLPNQGFGPYAVINPYLIWWMVVLIAGLSFIGYATVKILGARRGLMITAAVGAFVSSTAITINFARFARNRPAQARTLAAGVMLASTVMVLRIGVVVLVLAPPLLAPLTAPLAAMAIAGAAATGGLLWRGQRLDGPAFEPSNPLDLPTALFFGLGLGLVMLLARLLEDYFGQSGIYGVALGTGLVDVDAMTVSASQLFKTGTLAGTAATAIVIAALANSFAKAMLGILMGGGAFARLLGLGYGAMIGAGALALAV